MISRYAIAQETSKLLKCEERRLHTKRVDSTQSPITLPNRAISEQNKKEHLEKWISFQKRCLDDPEVEPARLEGHEKARTKADGLHQTESAKFLRGQRSVKFINEFHNPCS